MSPKRIATSAMGIWIIFVVVAIAWQVTPASAGFTPTPPTATSISPTGTPIPPTTTSIPPTTTSIPPTTTSIPPTKHSPTHTHVPQVGTPEMPVTGGQVSGLSNRGGIVVVLLAGMMVFLLIAISLVIRQSARTKTEK